VVFSDYTFPFTGVIRRSSLEDTLICLPVFAGFELFTILAVSVTCACDMSVAFRQQLTCSKRTIVLLVALKLLGDPVMLRTEFLPTMLSYEDPARVFGPLDTYAAYTLYSRTFFVGGLSACCLLGKRDCRI
jgi:hypothetical protein